MTAGPRAFPNHFMSIYQSAAEEYERRRHGGTADTKSLSGISMVAEATRVCDDKARGQLDQPDRPKVLSGSVAACAYIGYRYLEALVQGDQRAVDKVGEQFDSSGCDPRWIKTLEEYYGYFGSNGTQGVIPYRRAAQVGSKYVIPLKPNAKIAVVGDWGTGAPPAIRVIRQVSLLKPDLVIHLGDIYYSGTSVECKENFSDIIDKELRQTSKIPVFTLAGNHDMYSGGKGYYDLIDRLNDGRHKQKASFFCLRSEDDRWQLLGLDTGLHDVSLLDAENSPTFLEPDEEQWHLDRIAEFSGRTILLSHHQPFSAYSRIGSQDAQGRLCPYNPLLMKSFQKFGANKVSAWLWGHEHNLCLYKTYRGVARGRCVGHGAIPVFAVEQPYNVLEDAADPPELWKDHPIDPVGGAFANGFALVSLQPTTGDAEIKYYSDFAGTSKPICKETVPDGPLTWLHGEQGTFRSSNNPTSRIAFVVGNSRYMHVAPLPKAETDAQDVSEKLETLEFNVFGGFNVDLVKTGILFDDFVAQIKPKNTVVLYYSGHGIQVDGVNFIVPTDGSLASLQQPSDDISLQRMVNRILTKNPAKCLIFLDACRDNPFTTAAGPPASGSKSVAISLPEQARKFVARGLTPLEIAQDTQTFVAFAAEPGKFAYEGAEGTHSRFTEAFLKYAGMEGLNLEGLMRRVGSHVKAATKNRQRPWSQANLTEDFFFKPPSWEAVWQMFGLGALSGLVTSYFVFNDRAQFDYLYPGVGIFFALVVGYGIRKWGRGSFWAAALATAGGTLFFELGSLFLWWIGSLSPETRWTEQHLPFFEDTKLLRDIIGAAVAGPIVVFGCVIAGSLTTPALFRLQVYALAAVTGILVQSSLSASHIFSITFL
jgi:uncharacterized caspase-like protein